MKETEDGQREPREGRRRVQKKWRHIKEGVDDERDLGGQRKLSADIIQLSSIALSLFVFF